MSSLARASLLAGEYCLVCHNDDDKDGGPTLENHSLADVHGDAAVWEEVVRKLSSGMMPRSGKRPDTKTYADIIHWLQSELAGATGWLRKGVG